MTGGELDLVLNAVICAMRDGEPAFFTIDGPGAPSALPAGPLDPARDRTLEGGLRRWVAERTDVTLGYVEQLYTFGDEGRGSDGRAQDSRLVSIGYLALTRLERPQPGWVDLYGAFPWEDWRRGRPDLVDALLAALKDWAGANAQRRARRELAFGSPQLPWNDERVLDRYELLYEAGLVHEAMVDGRAAEHALMERTGRPLASDHRRIVATALARLRAKVKYRPVVFELMEPAFTLSRLQDHVEAIYGRQVHKQNFRRMVETAQLVEPTGETARGRSGRPAKLYRFRPAVIRERPAPGLRVR